MHPFFNGEDEWQEQGERNEGKCGDNDKCLTGADGAIRLRPNRATPTSTEIAKLDRPPINDGGTTDGRARKTGLSVSEYTSRARGRLKRAVDVKRDGLVMACHGQLSRLDVASKQGFNSQSARLAV